MNRRSFLKTCGGGIAAAVAALFGIGSSFPKERSLDRIKAKQDAVRDSTDYEAVFCCGNPRCNRHKRRIPIAETVSPRLGSYQVRPCNGATVATYDDAILCPCCGYAHVYCCKSDDYKFIRLSFLHPNRENLGSGLVAHPPIERDAKGYVRYVDGDSRYTKSGRICVTRMDKRT